MQIEVRPMRCRYINHLDPGVNKESWSDEELEILYSKYGEYGNKWFLLQKHLPGRYYNVNLEHKLRSKIIFMDGLDSS
jgi:myb proto-oncogene protein